MNRRLALLTLKYLLAPEAVPILAPNATTLTKIREPTTERGREETIRALASSAVETNDIRYLAKLIDLERFPWELVRNKAVVEGRIPVIQWLWGRGHKLKELCHVAAKKGMLRVLRCGLNRGYELGVMEYDIAAANGQLNVIKWLRAQGCPWDERVCVTAARRGHLEVLEWVRANGCPWDELVCAEAARHGHLEVLKWARANGCSFAQEPYNICHAGWANAQQEVLQWLKTNGCTCGGQFH
ncbi:MAG: hypothetical protein KGL39_27680 [Patescibacteria group bacterium]|nr:hypothetical protein [Patescibacteria group bacterium]